ncbi:hypothetical protein ACMHYB_25500 [Sorangium sp. So ce1128]
MHTRITLAMAALVGATACGAADEASKAGEDGAAEEAGLLPRSFELSFDPEEPAIPQIVAAGRHELAAACADNPHVSIRIFDPLDPDAFADVPCSSMLCDAESGEAPASAEGGEPIAVAQQPWSPFGLVCSIITTGSGLVSTYALCPRARNPHDRRNCDWLTTGGFTALGALCLFI